MSEPFFSRWSRLKRQTTQEPAPADDSVASRGVAPDTAAAEPGMRTQGGQPAQGGASGALPPEAAAPFHVPRVPPDAQHVPIPDVDALTSESDFAPFMQRQVSEVVRRQALRTLFADPRFNVMDGLDVYIDDYSISDPIPPEMLAGLEQTKRLFGLTASDADAAEDTTLTHSAGMSPPAIPTANVPPVATRDTVTQPETSALEVGAASGGDVAPAASCDNLSVDGQIVATESGKSV